MRNMGATKNDIAQILTDRGYPSKVVDDIVYVLEPLTKKDHKQVLSIMKEHGYNESFGVRLKNGRKGD